MLRLRVLSAAILAPALLIVLICGQPWLTLTIGLICALTAWEVFALLRGAGYVVQPWLGVAGAVLAVADAALGSREPVLSAGYLAIVIVAFAISAMRVQEPRLGFSAWVSGAFGVLYVGLLAFTVRIVATAPAVPRDSALSSVVDAGWLDAGRVWLLVLVLGVWTFDSFAYLAGRGIGRGRFMNHISPGKTWSGVIGGTIAAMVVTAALTTATGHSTAGGVILGGVIAVAAQAGDLAESMLKRAAGVKDSGRLIPGHGGMLDRVDSFLFAAPAAYVYIALAAALG